MDSWPRYIALFVRAKFLSAAQVDLSRRDLTYDDDYISRARLAFIIDQRFD